MATEKMITLRKSWLKPDQEEKLMKRLTQIISGDLKGPYKKDDGGYGWQLDGSNNWWAKIRDNKLLVTTRYGKNNKKFETLIPYLEAEFGPID